MRAGDPPECASPYMVSPGASSLHSRSCIRHFLLFFEPRIRATTVCKDEDFLILAPSSWLSGKSLHGVPWPPHLYIAVAVSFAFCSFLKPEFVPHSLQSENKGNFMRSVAADYRGAGPGGGLSRHPAQVSQFSVNTPLFSDIAIYIVFQVLWLTTIDCEHEHFLIKYPCT